MAFRNIRRDRQNPISKRAPKASLYSYYSNRTPRADPIRRDKSQIAEDNITHPTSVLLSKIFLMLAIVLTIILISDLMWLNTTPNISIINNSGSKLLLHDKTTYQKFAEKEFSKNALNHAKLIIDTTAVSRDFKKQFPELDSISVVLPLLGHQATIYLLPSVPKIELNNINHNYILDSNGKVLVSLPTRSSVNVSNLTLVNFQTAIVYQTNQQVLSSSDVQFIQFISSQLSDQRVAISNMDLVLNSREIDVHLTGLPYYVKFNLQADSKEQVGDFLALYNQLVKSNTIPSQYVDARVPGRVYYR